MKTIAGSSLVSCARRRAAGSLREFLDVALHEASPDHSTVSRTRRRIDLETGAAASDRCRFRQGQDDQHRCDDAGSECGVAGHRPPGRS